MYVYVYVYKYIHIIYVYIYYTIYIYIDIVNPPENNRIHRVKPNFINELGTTMGPAWRFSRLTGSVPCGDSLTLGIDITSGLINGELV